MKRLMFLFLLAFAVNSCSTEDTQSSQDFLLPIASVVIPDSYKLGHLSTMMVRYKRPTDCHIFNGFYTSTEGKTSIIAIKALKFNQKNCMNDDESIYEVPLKWTPQDAGTYIFKFWIGDSPSGFPQYIEHEIVVEY